MHLALGPGYRRAFETRREHMAIVEAFESQDLPALKAAIAEHMRESMKWFAAAQARVDDLALVASDPQPWPCAEQAEKKGEGHQRR